MANGAIAEFDIVGGRNEVFAGIGNGERYKVVRPLPESTGEGRRHCAHQPLKIGFGDAGFTPGRVMDPVWRFEHCNLRGHLLGMPKLDLRTAGHDFVFYSREQQK